VTQVLILGSSGHAKVIIEILREHPDLHIAGCLAAEPSAPPVCGVPVVGDDSALPRLRDTGVTHAFVAVGDNRVRSRIIENVLSHGVKLVNAISRHAVLSPSVHIGEGVALMAGAIVNAEAVLGDGAIVNTGAVVDHDCILGPMSHVGPGSTLAGCVQLGAGSFLGTGCRVVPGVRIGDWSVVGAGATVLRDVPDHVVSVGVPARILKKVAAT
jgi:UDP-perosamine 4-acetyltransferase